MQTLKIRKNFLDSEEAKDIAQVLNHMMSSSLYNTEPSYIANGFQYPDNLMPFVDKHLTYLNSHPKLDAKMYMANLRLITRVR
jgi:hypothetical protein